MIFNNKEKQDPMIEVTYSFASAFSVLDWFVCLFLLHRKIFFNYWNSCLNFNQVNNIPTTEFFFFKYSCLELGSQNYDTFCLNYTIPDKKSNTYTWKKGSALKNLTLLLE